MYALRMLRSHKWNGGLGKEIALAIGHLLNNHKILIVDDEANFQGLREDIFGNILTLVTPEYFDMPTVGRREKTWGQPRRKNNYKSRRRK